VSGETARRMDASLCATLAHRAIGGDTTARDELIAYLWPHWIMLLTGNRSLGTFAKNEDHVRNVATLLLAKLNGNAGHGLESYASWQQMHPGQDFGDWMRIVVTNCARDYVRTQLGARTENKDAPSAKRLLNEFALAPARDEVGFRPPFTQEQTARELLEYAAARLPPNQCAAIATWLQGGTFGDIESSLGLVAGQGRLVLRSAIASLRRHFGHTDGEIDDLEA